MKRFNWIDVVIVLILVAALALVVVKMTDKEPETLGAENVVSEPNLRIEVVCRDLTPEIANQIIASLDGEPREVSGQMVEKTRIFNSGNLVDGHITEWELMECDEPNEVWLRLTIEANAVLSKGSYSIGTQEIRLGRGFTAKTMDIEIGGIITVMTELKK